MASIHKDRRSSYWQASFRDAAGKLKIRSTKIEHTPRPLPKETAADTRRRKVENERAARLLADGMEQTLRGKRTDSHLRKLFEDVSAMVNLGGPMTFPKVAGFLDDWLRLECSDIEPSTFKRYAGTAATFKKSLAEKGRGDIYLTDLQKEDFDAFKADRMQAGYGPGTVRGDLKILKIAFTSALHAKKITFHPMVGVRLPEGAGKSREAFTSAEIQLLLDEAGKSEPEFVTAIYFAAFAGMRLGDATSMAWGNVDFFQNLITYKPKKTRRRSDRELKVPIHPDFGSHLMTLPAPSSPDDPITPGLCNASPSGRTGLSGRFNEICARAGIDQGDTAGTGEKGRAFKTKTFHSLRHSFITALETAGVAPDLRMLLAGHSDTRTHAKYTHTKMETLRKAVEKL